MTRKECVRFLFFFSSLFILPCCRGVGESCDDISDDTCRRFATYCGRGERWITVSGRRTCDCCKQRGGAAASPSAGGSSERIMACCRGMGMREDCLSLCKYTTTTEELFAQGLFCLDNLKIWTYCAAEESDNTRCCQSKSVVRQCLPFCKGEVPPLCFRDTEESDNFRVCAEDHLSNILGCNRGGVPAQPRWNRSHVFPRDKC